MAEVAAKSCEGLYKTLRRFSEAPRDIQHRITLLRALESTFTGIAALEQDAAIVSIITPEFKARLRACMLDLQAMETLAKSFNADLEGGKLRKTWAKMRWFAVDERQTFKSHLSQSGFYLTTFSQGIRLRDV